jgi:cation transport ATPase
MTAVETPAAPVEAKPSAAGKAKHKNNHQRHQEQEKQQQEKQQAKKQHAQPADSVFSQVAEDDEASTAEQSPASKPAAGKKLKQHKQKPDKQQHHQKQEKPPKGRKRRVFGVTLLVLAVLAVTLGLGVPKAAQVRLLTVGSFPHIGAYTCSCITCEFTSISTHTQPGCIAMDSTRNMQPGSLPGRLDCLTTAEVRRSSIKVMRAVLPYPWVHMWSA